MTHFFYITNTPCEYENGANIFEYKILKQMKAYPWEKNDITFHYKGVSFFDSTEKNKLYVRKIKKTFFSHFLRQVEVFFYIFIAYLNRKEREDFIIFVRHHPLMWAPYIFSWFFNVKTIVRTGPVVYNLSFNSSVNYFYKKILCIVTKFFFKKVYRFIVVTNTIKSRISSLFVIDPKKIFIVPNAIDLDFFNKKNHGNILFPEDRIIFVLLEIYMLTKVS